MSRVEFPGEISTRRLQDLVRPPQFADLALELGDAFPVIARRAGPLPGIHFRFLPPVAESLGIYPQPMADPGDRATRVPRFSTQFEDHRHRAFPQLRRVRLP